MTAASDPAPARERMTPQAGATSEPSPAGAYPLDWTLAQVKDAHIRRVVEANAGNKSAAARQLGVSRKTLERKLGSCGDGGED